MNFRSRALLDLAYELDCTLKIPGICEGGTGEPCHANWAVWGKGGAMKAHDFAFASGCRACHREIDQGGKLSAALRDHHWMAGHVSTMRQLWERGLLRVGTEATMTTVREQQEARGPSGNKGRRRSSRCQRSDKTVPRGARIV